MKTHPSPESESRALPVAAHTPGPWHVRGNIGKKNFPNAPTADKIRAELKEYCAWDAEELADDEQNWQRLVWCAAWDIAEDDAPDCSEPLKN